MNTKVTAPYSKLGALVNSMMKTKCVSHGSKREIDYFWNASHFGLDKVGIYQDLPEEVQNLILKLLTDHNLNESYFIEKMGMSYAAKMILLSESEEEKALYSAIACDEAIHLYEVKNFLNPGVEATYQGNGFLKFISDVAQTSAPKICQSVLQVSLEGHGMSYYSWLRTGCHDPYFKEVLGRIMQDEAAHHGSGVIIASQSEFNLTEKKELEEHLAYFGNLLNCTLFPIVVILEKVVGGFTPEQRIKVFKELEASRVNSEKLQGLSRLLSVSRLDEKVSSSLKTALTHAWGPEHCSAALSQMLTN